MSFYCLLAAFNTWMLQKLVMSLNASASLLSGSDVLEYPNNIIFHPPSFFLPCVVRLNGRLPLVPLFCHSASPGVKPVPRLSPRPVWTGSKGSAVCLSVNLGIWLCRAVLTSLWTRKILSQLSQSDIVCALYVHLVLRQIIIKAVVSELLNVHW